MTHGVLIAIVVLLVLTFQIKVFVSTLHKVKHFEGLFPNEASEEWTIARGWGGFFIVKKADYRQWQEDKKLIEAVKSEMDPSEYKKAQDKLKKEMRCAGLSGGFVCGICPGKCGARHYAVRF